MRRFFLQRRVESPTFKLIILPLSISRVFLLPCADGYLQIDGGYEHDYPAYRRELAKAGIAPGSVHTLLLTHHHDDHAGFLNALTRDAPVTIIAHRLSRELLAGGQNDRSRGGGYASRFIQLAAGIKMRFDPRWTLTFPPFNLRDSDILLDGDDDQVLRRLGAAGRVLYTPGHCIDHLIVVMDGGETFCGDAAANFLNWAALRRRIWQSFSSRKDGGTRKARKGFSHRFVLMM